MSNSGIYAKAREIILQYFEIIGITELGSNTFMATGTNTVTLFLRRRNNYESINLKASVKHFFGTFTDVTLNGIEKPVSKYIQHVWGGLSFDDYVSLAKKQPSQTVEQHEIYKEYCKKIKSYSLIESLSHQISKEEDKEIQKKLAEQKEKAIKAFWDSLIEIEQEKLFYFILAYPQKVVLIKSGQKDEEKRFLGFEFSNRRGSEGIHPIQRGKRIAECTKLFDENSFENPEKASTYIYKAFQGDFDLEIHESLQKNISRHDLVDMLTFDRVEFEKNISTSVKKKVKIESKWEIKRLGDVCDLYQPKTITSQEILEQGDYKVFGANGVIGYYDQYNHEDSEIAVTCRGATCGTVNFTEPKSWITGNAMVVKPKSSTVNKMFLYSLLSFSDLSETITGTAQPQITRTTLEPFQIPLPPLDIQQKIVSEIEVLEKKESKAKEEIEELKDEIVLKANKCYSDFSITKLGLLCEQPVYGANESAVEGNPTTDYRYIRITDIKDDGTLNDDWKTAENVEEKYILKDGDFLFARSGATAGKTFLYENSFGKALYAGYLIKFPVKQEILNSSFLNFVLKGDSYKNWVLEKRIGTAQPNINAQQYSSFEIPLPSLSEQQKIVAEIENIESRITALEKEITEIPKQKDAILKKYL